MNLVTKERLLQVLEYSPDTGLFVWRERTSNRISVGDVAGNYSHGYVTLSIDGRTYPAHRLAWLYMTGAWPNGEIDHIDRNRANNVFSNLREASHKQNLENIPLQRKGNTTGRRGVYWHKKNQKWTAMIASDKKMYYLGSFAEKSDAIAAREKAEGELFTHMTYT